MIRRKANNLEFLDILGLPATSMNVLLDIVSNGISSVADIATRLNMPKSTVYDSVTPLLDQSLINEYSNERGKTFGVSDSDQLARVHALKLKELQDAHSSFLSFIKDHHRNDNVARPKIKFYAGTLGIKQAFRDIPWTGEYKETYLMWPVKEMIGIDEEFFKWHGRQRFKYKVIINCIEKHSDRALQTKKHEWLVNDFKTNLVRIRYLPKGVDWKMSFWLYGNKCLFASSGTEKIAFTIHSKEFAHLMKILWQSMWNVAKV